MIQPRTAVDTPLAGHRQPMVAVVTGASGNIGRAICKRLLDDEWNVHAWVRRVGAIDELRPLRAEIGAPMESLSFVLADLEDTASAIGIHDRATALICAHGIAAKHNSADLPLSDFRHMLEINLTSCLALAKAYYPHMREAGFGRIVFISSIHGAQTYPQRAAYAASKAGLEALARVLALEWAVDGITVNTIAPGHLDVPMKGSPTDGDFLDAVKNRTPTGALATAEQIASLTAWLLSDDAAQVNGQTLRVDGGLGVSAWPGE